MCDQSKTIATSFMCGKDLDNYLKNQYYAGPFTQGTRMLNKYRTNSTNPCIDHYENLQFEGCCNAVKNCNEKKQSPCKRKPQQNHCAGVKRPPAPSLSSCSSSSSCNMPPPPPPPCCCRGCPHPPRHEEPMPCCNPNEDDEDPVTKRCKQLYNRGRAFLAQIERTTLPKMLVEEDDYLPSIMGCGWQIATKPRILGKSKFQIRAYDPYLMLHSWQEMQGICCTDGKSHTGSENVDDINNIDPENEITDDTDTTEDEKKEEQEEIET